MTYLVVICLLSLIVGAVGVGSNPAPYFAALGLVITAGAGCGVLVSCGGSFLSLVLLLVYLGGMVVVFAYSAALAAEPFPETWGDGSVVGYVVGYVGSVGVLGGKLCGGWYEGSWWVVDELCGVALGEADAGGVALVYSLGGGVLIVCA